MKPTENRIKHDHHFEQERMTVRIANRFHPSVPGSVRNLYADSLVELVELGVDEGGTTEAIDYINEVYHGRVSPSESMVERRERVMKFLKELIAEYRSLRITSTDQERERYNPDDDAVRQLMNNTRENCRLCAVGRRGPGGGVQRRPMRVW